MKKITAPFIISNITSGVILIFSIPFLKEQHDDIFNKVDITQGIIIISAFIIGFYLRIVKSREVAATIEGPNLSVFEKIILSLIYIFSMTIPINMVFGSFSLIFGDLGSVPDPWKIVQFCLMFISFGILVYEIALLSGEFKPKVKKTKAWVNILYYLYIGIGVAVSWDMMVVGSKTSPLDISASNFWSEFIASIFLALMLMMPFQRLFWYEVFKTSSGWKDNLKVTLSFLLVLAAAITPLFFK